MEECGRKVWKEGESVQSLALMVVPVVARCLLLLVKAGVVPVIQEQVGQSDGVQQAEASPGADMRFICISGVPPTSRESRWLPCSTLPVSLDLRTLDSRVLLISCGKWKFITCGMFPSFLTLYGYFLVRYCKSGLLLVGFVSCVS